VIILAAGEINLSGGFVLVAVMAVGVRLAVSWAYLKSKTRGI
jgi:hypothetical protein